MAAAAKAEAVCARQNDHQDTKINKNDMNQA